jgi:hypothetical protein
VDVQIFENFMPPPFLVSADENSDEQTPPIKEQE